MLELTITPVLIGNSIAPSKSIFLSGFGGDVGIFDMGVLVTIHERLQHYLPRRRDRRDGNPAARRYESRIGAWQKLRRSDFSRPVHRKTD